MNIPFLIIISGESGTGKTTFGKQLAKELSFPFLSRDALKERMFDSLGVADRKWSHDVGLAAYEILYHMTETLLKAGTSLVIEITFKTADVADRLNTIKSHAPYFPVKVRLVANNTVLLERFKQRAESGQRHPGHVVMQQTWKIFNRPLKRQNLSRFLQLEEKHYRLTQPILPQLTRQLSCILCKRSLQARLANNLPCDRHFQLRSCHYVLRKERKAQDLYG